MKSTALSCALAAMLFLANVASGHEFTYTATLTGSAAVPSNASTATGLVTILLDLDLVTMDVDATFSGLSSPVTGAHIHGVTATPLSGVAGVASPTPTLPGFPSGVTAGTYGQTIDLTTASGYSSSFITASGGTVSDALNALINGMADERMYFQIDTVAFPNGEIRGFLTAEVPEPASLSGLSVSGLLLIRRRKVASGRH